jgi:hypothetical protein
VNLNEVARLPCRIGEDNWFALRDGSLLTVLAYDEVGRPHSFGSTSQTGWLPDGPWKSYPVDPGLIPPFERTGRGDLGHALETAVLLELERRGDETAYVRTPHGWLDATPPRTDPPDPVKWLPAAEWFLREEE